MAQDGTAGGANVSGSQGVQVGEGGTQINNWTVKPQLDPASLGALNPHTAVARIRQMPHDDVVDLFARAAPADVMEVLKAFLEADEHRFVPVLADISQRRLRDLIAPLTHDWPWLESVPEAATAINSIAASRGWIPAPPVEHLECLGRYERTASFTRTYVQGRIYWTLSGGARALSGQIAEHHSASSMGYPISDEERVETSPFGTEGTRQDFQLGSIYSSAKGTFSVHKPILSWYRDAGATASWIGFPTARAARINDSWTTQSFEGGAIHHKLGTGGYLIRKPVLECLNGRRFPVSAEAVAPPSPHGTTGTFQEFEDESGVAAVVYSSDKATRLVTGRMLAYYLAQDATSSWLGFPTGVSVLSSALGKNIRLQRFEGGAIYERPESPAVGVTIRTLHKIVEGKPGLKQLGYPTSEEKYLDAAKNESVQFFENGVVTFRDGKGEIWLRS